jgi:hypothetical protein
VVWFAHLRLPDPNESPFAFFQRHELPLSGYRNYLHDCLHSLFGAPFDYVMGKTPVHAGPIGLSGSDARRWIHETRIPNEVHLRGHHLKAVFAPRRAGLVPEIRSFLSWCSAEGFPIEVFDADRENDFAKLQSACIEYLRKELK